MATGHEAEFRRLFELEAAEQLDRLADTVLALEREGGRRVLRFGLPVLGMVAVAQWLGLYVAMALYLLVAIRWTGGRRLTTALAVAAGVTLASYVVFEKWFGVPLLKGPLETLLGLG